eukprot:CAMPEP_0201500558 /NCGR_PEP_ID=MMETSP0151_2-20130828/82094_1 /ASSEMBLY_ACC=CAM_ASM_000257 /TAXON_ID=200890 /ORGANISM="Paramoeba atlantica, Strain 621/1 / CCAP 1560/9" /LENGTH=34 /DNA_ID= /DNA_START= /DNA_END= /DNA_ORIENTATION=
MIKETEREREAILDCVAKREEEENWDDYSEKESD